MIADTNIVLHLIEEFAEPGGPSVLRDYAVRNSLIVNEIIFAELSAQYQSIDAVTDMLAALGIRTVRLTLDECFRAGTAFREYRRRGGARTTVMPDFLIGAQAAEKGWPLLTRDRKGFASYFPEIEIVDPYKADND